MYGTPAGRPAQSGIAILLHANGVGPGWNTEKSSSYNVRFGPKRTRCGASADFSSEANPCLLRAKSGRFHLHGNVCFWPNGTPRLT